MIFGSGRLNVVLKSPILECVRFVKKELVIIRLASGGKRKESNIPV